MSKNVANISDILEKIPDDFDWITYIALNKELGHFIKNKIHAMYHYVCFGSVEKRPYRVPKIEDNNITRKFNYGVNIFTYKNEYFGLGKMGKLYINTINELNIPYKLIYLDENNYEDILNDTVEYYITLILCGYCFADTIGLQLANSHFKYTYKIGVFPWELETIDRKSVV